MPEADLIRPYLSPFWSELEGRIGWDAFRRIVQARGGTWIKVPRTHWQDSLLAEIAGEEAAEILSHWYGGEELRPPNLKAALGALKTRRIAARVNAGHNATEIALAEGVTDRWVRRVKAACSDQVDAAQSDLFDAGDLPQPRKSGRPRRRG